MQLSELHRFPIRTQVLQLRSEVAALQFQNLLLKCIIEERAYNPNQPRVPAGEPDGGQWTDGGFHLLKPRHDPGRRDEEDAVQVAQNRGGGFNPVIHLGRSWVGATHVQQVRLAVAQAQASAAVGRAQQVDPTWRPQRGLSAPTVEGEITRNETLTREAEAHLIRLGRRAPEARPSPEFFAPGGQLVGSRTRGAGDEVRTVSSDAFRQLLGEIGHGARPVVTPPTYGGQWYRRYDGSTIGVRFSREHGVTIDAIGFIRGLPQSFKVHAK